MLVIKPGLTIQLINITQITQKLLSTHLLTYSLLGKYYGTLFYVIRMFCCQTFDTYTSNWWVAQFSEEGKAKKMGKGSVWQTRIFPVAQIVTIYCFTAQKQNAIKFEEKKELQVKQYLLINHMKQEKGFIQLRSIVMDLCKMVRIFFTCEQCYDEDEYMEENQNQICSLNCLASKKLYLYNGTCQAASNVLFSTCKCRARHPKDISLTPHSRYAFICKERSEHQAKTCHR